jgi:hypothetical protein
MIEKIDSGLTVPGCPYTEQITYQSHEIATINVKLDKIKDNHLPHIENTMNECKVDMADIKGQLKIILGFGAGIFLSLLGVLTKVLFG